MVAKVAKSLFVWAKAGKFTSFSVYSVTILDFSNYFFISLKEDKGLLFLFLFNFHLKATSSDRFNL